MLFFGIEMTESKRASWKELMSSVSAGKSLKGEPIHFSGLDLDELRIQDKMNYGKLGHLTDQRKPRAIGQTSEQVFNNLIDVILNAKKDIIRINELDDYENAKEYASKHGLRISSADTDVNHDGINDVILYNKAGQPVIVNGYKLMPSQQPIRKLYQAAKRTGTLNNPDAGMRGYVRQLYGASDVWNENGEREVKYDNENLPPELKGLRKNGWLVPTAPRRKMSAYQYTMNLIKNIYADFKKDIFKQKDNNKEWVNGILPRFKLFSLIYLDVVERHGWDVLNANLKQQFYEQAQGDPFKVYRLYMDHKKANSKEFRKWMEKNMDTIISFTNTEFPNSLVEILKEIGLTEETLNTFVNEDDILKMKKDERNDFEELKAKYKYQFDSAADKHKNTLIQSIFSPPT